MSDKLKVASSMPVDKLKVVRPSCKTGEHKWKVGYGAAGPYECVLCDTRLSLAEWWAQVRL